MSTAWIAGASGLVGGAVLQRLLADAAFERVISVGRRTLPIDHPKLAQVLFDFSAPGTLQVLDPPDAAFCCLGTTIKKAGSRPAFRAVDHDAVVVFAQAARARGARTFLHVTALGANPRSAIFYNAVKGQVEEAVARVGLRSVYAFRPSLLDGERAETRPGERLGLAIGRVLGPVLGKYGPTTVVAVAEAMIAAAKDPRPGVHVVEPGSMRTPAMRGG
jgi:uncharacterized protein YbjT (DUF2867 family)